MKKIWLLFITIPMLFSSFSINASSMPGARSEEKAGNVFLGGNYIEIGIAEGGTFGTSVAPDDTSFHPLASYSNRLGLMVDKDGWDVGNPSTTGDFFLPGSPYEGYWIKYNGNTYRLAERSNVNDFPAGTTFVTVDQSDIANGKLKALTTVTLPDGLVMTQTVSFDVNDKFYVTKIEFTNNTGAPITDVQYIRGFDPDQDRDLNGTFQTYNKIVANPDPLQSGDQKAMLVARGEDTLEAFFFISNDINARASFSLTWNESDSNIPVSIIEANYVLDDPSVDLNGYSLDDRLIYLITKIDDINSGAKDGTTFISSLDPDVQQSVAAVEVVLEEVAQESAPAPEPTPEPTPAPPSAYVPPRLQIEIEGYDFADNYNYIPVGSDFVIPKPTVVYENTGEPYFLQDVEVYGFVNTSVLGTYRVEYLYRHHDRGVIRRVDFKVVDTIKPQATWEIENVLLGEEWVDDILITDNYDTEFYVNVRTNLDTSKLGSYLLFYRIGDKSLNYIYLTRRVNVIPGPSDPVFTPDDYFYIRANEYNQYAVLLSPLEFNTSGIQFFYQQAEEVPAFDDPNWVAYEGLIETSGYEPMLYIMAVDDEGRYFIREAFIGQFDPAEVPVFERPELPEPTYRSMGVVHKVAWWVWLLWLLIIPATYYTWNQVTKQKEDE